VAIDPNRLTASRAGALPDAARFAARAFAQPPSPSETLAPLYLRPPDAKPQNIRPSGSMQFSVREAGEADAPIFATLHAECFDNPWTMQDFAQLAAMPGALCLIAAENGEPIAFALARAAAGEAEIITVGTRPFARRRGMAQRLLQECMARLKGLGATDLFIEVARSNGAAIALYRSTGFVEAGVRRGYYARPSEAGEDALVMRRAI
jgi:ribosomal-protein-alanine N-acetyltransferase